MIMTFCDTEFEFIIDLQRSRRQGSLLNVIVFGILFLINFRRLQHYMLVLFNQVPGAGSGWL